MGSFFVVQGAHMDRTVVLPKGLGTFDIPAASLSMINTFAIVGLIPFYDKLLAPALRRAGRPLTLLKRIGWGLVVCLGAMLCASYVEWYRLKLFNQGHVIPVPSTSQNGGDSMNGTVVDMSVWWQVPQYLLIGLSEVFTSIGQMEFFYDQAPDVMRSCSMALQLLSVAIGSYLSGAVVWATQIVTSKIDPFGFGWLPKDLNKGRLDLFFLVLGGLMVVNIIHFISVSLKYEYKAVEHVKRVAPRRMPSNVGQPPRPRTAPMPSTGPSAAHPAMARRIQAADSPAPQPYGRSVTFLPQTPAMPAPFR
jgi:peptide/histidine transporter 3/4